MLRIVEPLTEAQMRWLPPNNSNSIAWLVWHLAEVENNWVRDKLHGLPKRYPLGASVRATSIEQYPSKAELLAYF
ncbi:MAG: DinB family protein, partial [Candidatus Eisenbacteria bacterium]|nr:DinB family protein [Candidatus Eisenbacteria bacterium]